MRNCRRWLSGLAAIAVLLLVTDNPVNAYYRYGHRNNRSGRNYGRMMRASAASSAAQAKVFAAQSNLARQVKLAKEQAEKSPALSSAKSEHTQSAHDYQSTRASIVDNLKQTNPEFKDLQQRCSYLRQQIASIAKSGTGSGDLKSMESELRNKARRISQIENEAINNDSTIKDALGRQALSHTAEVAANKEAQAAIANNPSVKAAQQQLAQANQQAMQAANSLANSSMGGYGGYGRGRRGYGHRGYGYGGYGGYGRGYHVSYVHHRHHRRYF